ncbi:hypothetical protein Q9966_011721 [Columba livia]|nr:hypothetical protein Q9966_011721 [Columba livia]
MPHEEKGESRVLPVLLREDRSCSPQHQNGISVKNGLTTDSEAKDYCDLALVSHSTGDANVLVVLVLIIYERAQKESSRMLESYVTPILMSYVNRYIKNLKPSDLQLSLWGGDVVLSKLELKLDVLEQELKLPFTFLSGHIHELRIHVPWTKLGSEPVVITINTMECILKLKDGAQHIPLVFSETAVKFCVPLIQGFRKKFTSSASDLLRNHVLRPSPWLTEDPDLVSITRITSALDQLVSCGAICQNAKISRAQNAISIHLGRLDLVVKAHIKVMRPQEPDCSELASVLNLVRNRLASELPADRHSSSLWSCWTWLENAVKTVEFVLLCPRLIISFLLEPPWISKKILKSVIPSWGRIPLVPFLWRMATSSYLAWSHTEDHESCGSSSNRSTTESVKSAVKPRRVQQSASPDPDLPPGYVQSLIRRVVNNVNIVINNLILKYVEDDIVLSVNITSAECYTVDEFWDRAFMDISATDLVLRKMINFSDCTVCLDKRNASGKIEFYQEPLLYKCSFRTRLHFTYDNLNSKMPSIIKIHTLVESLKLSISDQQLPMFIRIMQLGIALYYGEIGNFKDGESEDLVRHSKDMLGNITGAEDETSSVMQYPAEYVNQDPYLHQDGDQQQGWVSWAWSFVPAIVSYDDEENDSSGTDDETMLRQQKSQSLKDPVISVGFYCTKATVTFKLTEMQAESSYYSPQKVKSKEVLCWEQEGTTVEVLMKGELFFDCQIGFVGCQAMCLKGIMGIKDFEENMNRSDEEAYFFNCGENLSAKGMTYLTNSLFDYRSPENNSIRAEFILDAAHHKETYTEIAGMQRFGAFYMDYLYTMESTSGKVSGNQQDLSSVKSEDFGNVQEMSTKSIIVGPLNLRLDSSAVHRIMKMIVCALEHEYEPYSRTKPEEVASLEEYIPTRLTTFTVLKCTIIIPVAEFNLLDHLMPIIMGEKNLSGLLNAASFQPLRPLPSVRILVDKVNVEHSVPMYAEQLVHTVSSLSQPSDNLLHYCYSHCYLKVFGFQAALTCLDSKGLYCFPVPVIPSFSTALYGKLIKFPKYCAFIEERIIKLLSAFVNVKLALLLKEVMYIIWRFMATSNFYLVTSGGFGDLGHLQVPADFPNPHGNRRTKRAHVPLTECIFELPNLTVQATRAQTLLLQTIYQSWCHPVGNVSSVVVNEALLNEVFQTSVSQPADVGGQLFLLELRIFSLIEVTETRVRDGLEVAGDFHVGVNPGSSQAEMKFLKGNLNKIMVTAFSGVKSKNPLPTLEGSIQNIELKYCGTSLVKCASGTVGSIKICAKAPGDGGKEKLIPLIQGPSDTRDLHSSKWLNESRKPESLLAPDLVAFTIQIPQYMDYCHNSGLEVEQEDSFVNSFIHNSLPLANRQFILHPAGRMPAKHLVAFDKSYLVPVRTSAMWLASFREMQTNSPYIQWDRKQSST